LAIELSKEDAKKSLPVSINEKVTKRYKTKRLGVNARTTNSNHSVVRSPKSQSPSKRRDLDVEELSKIVRNTQQEEDKASAEKLQKAFNQEMELRDFEIARRMQGDQPERNAERQIEDNLDIGSMMSMLNLSKFQRQIAMDREEENLEIRPTYTRTNLTGQPRLMRQIQDSDANNMSYEALTQLEDVKIGVKAEQLSVLTSEFIYTGQNLSDKECSVCMDSFEQGSQLRRLNCLHCFHRECIDKWLISSKLCPNCKCDITQNQ